MASTATAMKRARDDYNNDSESESSVESGSSSPTASPTKRFRTDGETIFLTLVDAEASDPTELVTNYVNVRKLSDAELKALDACAENYNFESKEADIVDVLVDTAFIMIDRRKWISPDRAYIVVMQ